MLPCVNAACCLQQVCRVTRDQQGRQACRAQQVRLSTFPRLLQYCAGGCNYAILADCAALSRLLSLYANLWLCLYICFAGFRIV